MTADDREKRRRLVGKVGERGRGGCTTYKIYLKDGLNLGMPEDNYPSTSPHSLGSQIQYHEASIANCN